MASITLSPPSEGTDILVPLMQSKVVTLSGTFELSERDGVMTDITVTANGKSTYVLFDIANPSGSQGTFHASLTVECPNIVLVHATLFADRRNHNLNQPEFYEIKSNTCSLTVSDSEKDPRCLIICRLVDGAGHYLPGLQIEAFDQDHRSQDDKLGSPAVTDVDGIAQFIFHRSDFSDNPGERNPDVYFKIHQGGTRLKYDLPGEPNENGVLRNFQSRLDPVIVHVEGVQGYVVQGIIRDKWIKLGANTGFLGLPTTNELSTPDGRGSYNHFQGGSIYQTPEWGVFEIHGLILKRWSELGWEQSFLGFPVSDELPIPGTNGERYSLFEHGIVTWAPGQAVAVAGQHHYERIYAQVRAQILSRFFAIGYQGRRNYYSMYNTLRDGPIASKPPSTSNLADAISGSTTAASTLPPHREDELKRWRITSSNGENPMLCGVKLNVALAVEHDAGNVESTRALEAALATYESLFTWVEPGSNGTARLPQRWDAGIYIGGDPNKESDQFLVGSHGAYMGALPASDIHSYARRDFDTLKKLLGPIEASQYSENWVYYWQHYRVWELSMDELNGLVTSYWAIATLSKSATLSATVARQAGWVGNYLADNGYLLVRPMGGLSCRGSTGILPAMEHPISRALGFAAGANFSSRTDFRGAMTRAGYWPLLVGPITACQALSWTVASAAAILSPVALDIGIASLDSILVGLVGQVISPSTIGGAIAVLTCSDCFDIKDQELPEVAFSLIFKDLPKKDNLYWVVTVGASLPAIFNQGTSPSLRFPATIGLTGFNDSDATVRNTFNDWFNLRHGHPEIEWKGLGSRSLFAYGVSALINSDTVSETRLVAGIEQAIVELFRECYFEPKLPIKNMTEYCEFPGSSYDPNSPDGKKTPYSPIDFIGATALAFWHAKRRAEAGTPVTTPRFPEPLSTARFAQWPRAAVPADCLSALRDAGIPVEVMQGSAKPTLGADGYSLFELPPVPRHAQPTPGIGAPATKLLCNVPIRIFASDAGDIATGVTLFPGHEIQIDSSGDIWAGVPADLRNGPDGLPRPIHDARWPLHTGIDPAANAFCLLGRLNGYFRIGSVLPRTRWVYHAERPLFLRINDDGPGDGNGFFDVSIQIWGPPEFNGVVYRKPNVLVDGGILRTSEPADLIEVTVTQIADPNAVEFALETPDDITWRKEILVITQSWMIWTQDTRHSDAIGVYLYQLPGATLTFNKMKGGGGIKQVLVLGGLDAIPPGSRVTFKWVND